MYVLITGGSGNLARHCLAELRAHGHEVTLFDRVSPEQTRSPWSTDAPIVLGEMTSAEDCLRAVEASRAEAIINLGGIPYPTEHPQSRAGATARGETPLPEDETFRVNVMGTYYIADAARKLGVRVIAHASTMSTLGVSPRTSKLTIPVNTMPVDESHPLWGENTYSLSKILNEETLLGFARGYGVQMVVMRLMHVYMPHRGEEAAIQMRLGQPAAPYTPGNFTVWEYLDARDAAAAYRLAVEAKNLDPFERFFLATDRMCVEEHRELAARYYPHLADQAARMGPDDLILSIRRIRSKLGYVPKHSWRGAEANARVT